MATLNPSASSGSGEPFGTERTEPAVTFGVAPPLATWPLLLPFVGAPRLPETEGAGAEVLGGRRVGGVPPATNVLASASVGNFLNLALDVRVSSTGLRTQESPSPALRTRPTSRRFPVHGPSRLHSNPSSLLAWSQFSRRGASSREGPIQP